MIFVQYCRYFPARGLWIGDVPLSDEICKLIGLRQRKRREICLWASSYRDRNVGALNIFDIDISVIPRETEKSQNHSRFSFVGLRIPSHITWDLHFWSVLAGKQHFGVVCTYWPCLHVYASRLLGLIQPVADMGCKQTCKGAQEETVDKFYDKKTCSTVMDGLTFRF